MNATDMIPVVVDSYNKGKIYGKEETLREVYEAFEKVDNWEFATFTLCFIKETLERLGMK